VFASPFGEEAVMGSSNSEAKEVRCTFPGLLLATQDGMLACEPVTIKSTRVWKSSSGPFWQTDF